MRGVAKSYKANFIVILFPCDILPSLVALFSFNLPRIVWGLQINRTKTKSKTILRFKPLSQIEFHF